MSNKVLKIAGKDPSGNALGVSVNSFGEMLVSDPASVIFQENISEAAGDSHDFSFFCGSPFRIFFFINSGNEPSVPWDIKITYEQVWKEGDASASRRSLITADKVVVESDGSPEVVTGNGVRAAAYSDLIVSVGNYITARLTNKDPSRPLVGKIFVVKYGVAEVLQDIVSDKSYPDTILAQVVVDSETPATQVLYETDDYTRIEYLEVGSNNKDYPSFQIIPKDAEGGLLTALGMVGSNTGAGGGMNMRSMDENFSSLFDRMYRADDGAKYSLNRYMTFPHGVRILFIKGSSPVGTSFAIRGYAVRKIK